MQSKRRKAEMSLRDYKERRDYLMKRKKEGKNEKSEEREGEREERSVDQLARRHNYYAQNYAVKLTQKIPSIPIWVITGAGRGGGRLSVERVEGGVGCLGQILSVWVLSEG